MATENERPSRDNDGEGRRSSDRNESGRPYNDRGEKKIFNRRDKGEGRDGGERRSYGNDRREERGDRKPYGDRREGGERRSFGGDRERREGGERKSYGDRREGGEGRSFGGDRERKTYGDRKEGGERRSFGGDRERKPYGDRGEEGGERRPYGDRREGGERRSYGDRPEGGDRREGGERRFDSERGERKSFGGDRREGGERRSYGNDRREAGERRSFGGNRDRKPYGDRREGGDRERKPYGDRREGGERKPYGDRREGGEGRSFGGDRERKPYGDRKEGGERRSFGGDRERKPYGDRGEEGGERRPYGDRREGGERKSFDRKDKFSKGGEERRSRSFDRSSDSELNPETPNYDLRRYKDNPRIKKTNRKGEDEDGSIRLNRYIANAGVCSRREADELILSGEIKVNGEAVTEMGFKVQPSDTVTYGKKVLSREKMVYVLLNKPKDFITTTEDPEGRKTVMSLVEKASKERIFPVGRLDRNTTGLLLFTNDGELAQKLTHPSNEIKKIYQVELDKPITKDDFQKVVEGVELEDGKAMVDDVAMLGDSKKFLGLEIHIGRNRIVRRIFEHLGYEVVTLDRVQYAGLTKKDLPRSEWRYLSEKEVIRLKYFM